MKPGDFVHSLGDAHLYSTISSRPAAADAADASVAGHEDRSEVKDIFAFRYEDFSLQGYDPHPHIKAEVAV